MSRFIRLIFPLIIALGLLVPGVATTAAAQDASTASMRITLRACDTGVDPQATPDACDIPIDAPMRAELVSSDYADAYQYTIDENTPRENDGTYVIDGIPAGLELTLRSFAPLEHDAFMYTGVDSTADIGWDAYVNLAAGEVRDVAIYYWNEADGPSMPAENEVHLTLRGCPDGVDPNVDATECTIPIDAPADATWGTNRGTGRAVSIADQPRLDDGTYVLGDIAAYSEVLMSGFQGTAHDSFLVTQPDDVIPDQQTGDTYLVYVTRGETRELTVYYYNAGAEYPEDPGETATVQLTFRGCPDGVDPTVDATDCTIPLDAPPAAAAQWYSGSSNAVVDHERLEDGTYVVDGIDDSGVPNEGPPWPVSLTGFQGSEHASYLFVGVDSVDEAGNGILELQPGEVREVTIYYYN